MSLLAANWVGENTQTIGTGPILLSGAIDGFARFNVMGDGQVYYVVQNGLSKETGIGTLTGNILERTTIHATIDEKGVYSDTPSPISLTGNAQVFGIVNAEFMQYLYNNIEVLGTTVADTLAAKAAATAAATAAGVSETNSHNSELASNSSETNSAASAAIAEAAAQQSQASAVVSETHATAAAASESVVAASATSALDSAGKAKASETASANSENSAATSAAASSQSASDALASKNAAATSANSALANKNASDASAADALASQSAAAASAAAAANSSGQAASSASAANSSKTSAALSAQTAADEAAKLGSMNDFAETIKSVDTATYSVQFKGSLEADKNLVTNGDLTVRGQSAIEKIANSNKYRLKTSLDNDGLTGYIQMIRNAPQSGPDTIRAQFSITDGNRFIFSGDTTVNGIFAAATTAPSNPSQGQFLNGAPIRTKLRGRGSNADPDGAFAGLYFQEQVGSTHRAILQVNGFGSDTNWSFNSGGKISTPLGDVQTSGSDVRIKDEFEKASAGAGDRIDDIGLVEYTEIPTGRRRRGWIAQQVDTIDPLYAYLSNGILNTDDRSILADLISTVQELRKEVAALKAK